METPLSTQVKNIFEEALAENETTIIFEPWRSCYNVTFETGFAFKNLIAKPTVLIKNHQMSS